MTDLRTIPGGDGMPPEPDWDSLYSDPLDIALARETWGEVTREMQDAGTLAVVNGHAIKRLIDFRLIYERHAREAAEHGAVTKAKKTGVLQYSPHWIVARQAHDSMAQVEDSLGISPLKRGKVTKAGRRKDRTGAADTYLNRKGA